MVDTMTEAPLRTPRGGKSVPGKYEKYFSPKPGDSDIGTGAEAGAADVVSPVADKLQDP